MVRVDLACRLWALSGHHKADWLGGRMDGQTDREPVGYHPEFTVRTSLNSWIRKWRITETHLWFLSRHKGQTDRFFAGGCQHVRWYVSTNVFVLTFNNNSNNEKKKGFSLFPSSYLLLSQEINSCEPRSSSSIRRVSVCHLSFRAVHLYKGSNILNYLVLCLYSLASR